MSLIHPLELRSSPGLRYVLTMMNRHIVCDIIGLLLMLCLCCSLLRPCACGIAGLALSSRNGRCVTLKKGSAVHGKASSRRSDAKKLSQRRKQRKRERARQTHAAEEAGCTKGKWPRWTQDN